MHSFRCEQDQSCEASSLALGPSNLQETTVLLQLTMLVGRLCNVCVTALSNVIHVAQVKCAALLVLLYLSAGDSDGRRKVAEAGGSVVTLLEMLSMACSWPASALQELPVSSGPALPSDTATEAEASQAAHQNFKASLQFMQACNALMYNLNRGQDVSAQLKLSGLTPECALIASAVGTCNWEPVQAPSANAGSPLAKLQRLWRSRKVLSASFAFTAQTLHVWGDIVSGPQVNARGMFELASEIRKQQEAAARFIEASDVVVEYTIRHVTSCVLKLEDDRYVALGQQIERDVFVRSLLLQWLMHHPTTSVSSPHLLCCLAYSFCLWIYTGLARGHGHTPQLERTVQHVYLL